VLRLPSAIVVARGPGFDNYRLTCLDVSRVTLVLMSPLFIRPKSTRRVVVNARKVSRSHDGSHHPSYTCTNPGRRWITAGSVFETPLVGMCMVGPPAGISTAAHLTDVENTRGATEVTPRLH
jgi:hypothetical protein